MIKVNTADLHVGMTLARSILEPSKNRILLTAGQKLTEQYIARIQEIGIPTVYIQDNLGLEEIKPIVSNITIQEATQSLKESYHNCFNTGRLRVDKIKLQVESIIEEILTNKEITIGMADVKNYDDYTYQHSVNVCVLATLIGVSKGYNRKELYELALGAILHDLGKITVPRTILNKPDKLNDSERNAILAHPWEGFNIIRNSNQVPLLSAHVALQHHERLDGLGYPRQLSHEAIHEYAKITAVADIFDALISDRPYRAGFSNEQALQILRSEENKQISSELIDLLTTHISILPSGTVILLSTGDTAIVVTENATTPHSPVVKLLYNSSQQLYKNNKTVDLANFETIKIKRTFNSEETSQLLAQYLAETINND